MKGLAQPIRWFHKYDTLHVQKHSNMKTHSVVHCAHHHTAHNRLHGLNRPDQQWQLHMVLAWQVSVRGGSDWGGQLHLVQCRQVSDWIRPDCRAQLYLVQCWKVPDRVWSDWRAQLHLVCTRKVPDRVRSAFISYTFCWIVVVLYKCILSAVALCSKILDLSSYILSTSVIGSF